MHCLRVTLSDFGLALDAGPSMLARRRLLPGPSPVPAPPSTDTTQTRRRPEPLTSKTLDMPAESVAGLTSFGGTWPPDHARWLHRRLIWLYLQGSAIAVALCFLLFFLGLDFTPRQWLLFLGCIPAGMALYLIPDLLLIRRNYERVGRVLRALDAGEKPPPAEVSRAVVRALNLPLYSFLRIIAVHGPGAALAGLIVMCGGNAFLDAGFLGWQIGALFTIVLFFASPTHGIFEFFAVARAVQPVLERLSAQPGGDIDHLSAEDRARIKSTGLERKLLYLAIGVCAGPLVFFAGSVLLKVHVMFARINLTPPTGEISAFWLWVWSVVTVCLGGTVLLSWLTASEVTRSARKLLRGMSRVEGGDHTTRLQITTTDEYADLFRGFNLMTENLREEARILSLSSDLMGELKLDVLIARIMHAATELLDAERSTLFLYDKKRKELWSRFAEGVGTREIRFPSSKGIAGSVLTSGRMENIADPYRDPRFNQDVDRSTGFRTRCILAGPVFNKQGERIGVVQVLNKRGGKFTPHDENRLRAFAAQVGISLENARLFEEVIKIRDYNESILRSTSNGMMTVDESGRVTTVNPAAATLFNGDSQDTGLLLHAHVDRIFGGSNEWALKSIARVNANGEKDVTLDADLIRPDGGSVSVNMTVVPLTGENFARLGTLLIFEDLSAEKRVRSTMSRYMSKEVADQLLASGGGALEGSEQTLTTVFSDVVGFTAISEAVGPRETVSMLNEYFAEMIEVIFAHNGILDKYIGDAIMALFGAPFPREDDADRALRAACGMVVALRGFNARRVAGGRPPVLIGVGLNTGPAVLGSIGSPKRMEYTAIGDSVNLASRLEAATRTYGVDILVAEPTVHALREPHALREIDLLRVKGKTRPAAVYEALGHFSPEELQSRAPADAVFAESMRAWRAGEFALAGQGFSQVCFLHPADTVARLYVERCAHALANPPKDWDGVWKMTEKK